MLFEEHGTGQDVDLVSLCMQAARLFGPNSATASACFRHTSGSIHRASLVRILHDSLKFDSVVRDMLTSGHLCKLLARMEVFKAIANERIVGLPHRLFDARSQAERSRFFDRGGILVIEADILELPGVREMLNSESHLLTHLP